MMKQNINDSTVSACVNSIISNRIYCFKNEKGNYCIAIKGVIMPYRLYSYILMEILSRGYAYVFNYEEDSELLNNEMRGYYDDNSLQIPSEYRKEFLKKPYNAAFMVLNSYFKELKNIKDKNIMKLTIQEIILEVEDEYENLYNENENEILCR